MMKSDIYRHGNFWKNDKDNYRERYKGKMLKTDTRDEKGRLRAITLKGAIGEYQTLLSQY